MSTVASLSQTTTTGVLASGGLDSSILIGHLLKARRPVQPFYIRTGLFWQAGELPALTKFLQAVATPDLAELVVLDLPLGDLYQDHWSLTGQQIPAADSPDEAVFLPARNALLLVKAAAWCQLHGIGTLALAALGTSPFDDASAEFIHDFQAAINRGSNQSLQLKLPFGGLNKREVMNLGRDLPLELTCSCLAPVDGKHCGQCNKCFERRTAFRTANIEDRTQYAQS